MITKAIGAHGLWKGRLKAAIDSGKSEIPPSKACRDDPCEFGKWLYSLDTPKRTRRWSCVREHPAEFHREAGAILELALSGKKNEAKERMADTSSFSKVSTEPTQELMDWSNESR